MADMQAIADNLIKGKKDDVVAAVLAAIDEGVNTEHPASRATSRTAYSPPTFTSQAAWGSASPTAESRAAR